ncbi:MAG: hypothetical protein ACYDGM_00520 [Vulcanimicrobiaceae bacterium]
MVLSHEFVGHFFAYAPFVLGTLIMVVTYVVKRKETVAGAPIGQTFACANCGRRGVREHMLAQAHGGAVSWYCAHCAGTH